jgi:hypothetical protein
VNTQRDVEERFSAILTEAGPADAETFVERLKEEQPGLLRAWLMQQAHARRGRPPRGALTGVH